MGRRNRSGQENRAARRRRERTTFEPIGSPEFPGIMGWMQRNGRLLFLVGIIVMILSVGAGAFAATNPPSPATSDDDSATATATSDATADPNATPTEAPIQRQYSAPPPMTIDTAKSYSAIIHLEGGASVTVELLDDAAPEYVNNFVFLARNRFYDGLTFHRVLPGYVAQAGDPSAAGSGGPGYVLAEEENDEAFTPGSLSMATSAAGVSGSQFFITLRDTPELNPDFTVFGRVVSGQDALQALTPRDPDLANQPRGTVIERIEIVEE